MTSREIVQMGLAFAGPPRIAYGMGGGFPRYVPLSGGVRAQLARTPWTQYDGYWRCMTSGGNTWRRLENVTKGEVWKGALEESWDLLESYEFPQTDAVELYEEHGGALP